MPRRKLQIMTKRIATKEKELCNEELKLQKEQDRENRNIENTRNKEIVNINNKVEYQRLKQIELDNEIKKLKSSKEKINILFIASNPDIIFTDEEGVLREQQRLSLDKEARDIEESIQKHQTEIQLVLLQSGRLELKIYFSILMK